MPVSAAGAGASLGGWAAGVPHYIYKTRLWGPHEPKRRKGDTSVATRGAWLVLVLRGGRLRSLRR